MFTKLGALAAGALMAGTLVAAAPAVAAPVAPLSVSALTADFCGTSACSIQLKDSQVDTDHAKALEGDMLEVTVKGQPNKVASVALYLVKDPENVDKPGLTKVSGNFTATADANGVATIQVELPVLNNKQHGAGGFFIGFSDLTAEQLTSEKDKVISEPFAIFSQYASIVGSSGGYGTSKPLVLDLLFGRPGDKVRAEALIKGTWVSLGATASDKKASTAVFGADGSAKLQVAAPAGTPKGAYPIRLVNITTGGVGSQLGDLTVGYKETEKDKGHGKGDQTPGQLPKTGD